MKNYTFEKYGYGVIILFLMFLSIFFRAVEKFGVISEQFYNFTSFFCYLILFIILFKGMIHSDSKKVRESMPVHFKTKMKFQYVLLVPLMTILVLHLLDKIPDDLYFKVELAMKLSKLF